MPNDTSDAEKRRKAAIRKAVADELRAEAARQDLDQGQVAERVGMARATVNRLFKGSRPVDTEQLFAFADGLGFDAGDLIDRAKRKYREQLRRLDTED
ncbi:helix-turn-helix transcriptional regulator [Nocardia sp. BSTN01]|uniref:helix-turn-helix domain-containing protein n=1 Tax=Nocardia sp. BSTN01 TaxID=2783665 RepID=UPI00188DE2F3|nr:helix-turn-helix transcriptional regulator [Nocardia sp. BSTN01]MBF5002522.1 helix-turn-helix transcriptional regulator [Nocardia sp. BSTN01]